MPTGPTGQHGLYRKELISVHARFEGDSGRFSDPWDWGLTGVAAGIGKPGAASDQPVRPKDILLANAA